MTIATESGHWYSRKGEPVYEVEASKGGLRPTTLRDARKLGLVPSVSGIMDVAAREGLQNWKIDRHIETAFHSPPSAQETAEEFIARIKAEQRERAKLAPDLGSSIHGAIERCLAGKQYEFQEHVAGALRALREWCGDRPYEAEKSFAHPLGYGGRVDVHKRTPPGFVADFKSKEDFTPDKIPSVYDNHAMQLAAYRVGLGMPRARCAIIYISTSFPGLTHLIEIPNDELERGWRMFKPLLVHWQELKQYQTTELVEA